MIWTVISCFLVTKYVIRTSGAHWILSIDPIYIFWKVYMSGDTLNFSIDPTSDYFW